MPLLYIKPKPLALAPDYSSTNLRHGQDLFFLFSYFLQNEQGHSPAHSFLLSKVDVIVDVLRAEAMVSGAAGAVAELQLRIRLAGAPADRAGAQPAVRLLRRLLPPRVGGGVAKARRLPRAACL